MYSKGGRRKKRSKQTIFHNNNDCQTLALLMRQNTNYDLCAVKKDYNLAHVGCQDKDYYLLHLQNVEKGYFVCNLKDQNGGIQHCIGVQKTARSAGFIFDCREIEVLDFSKENLDKCCGPLSRCESIPYIGEIQSKRGK